MHDDVSHTYFLLDLFINKPNLRRYSSLNFVAFVGRDVSYIELLVNNLSIKPEMAVEIKIKF